ncbi:flavodoxin domain-containing protein [Xylophilus sp. GOD-11R]|uniref:flavodoxin domain-containing protein n=1 Tax=Xylophilus sp. GOD-11R TaxID=3089814 RepID=UPI00298CDDE0|nr:flavodoxin domain-containing protein [Xylophilus sp. GOD-11R]WPB59268.1 flavodoxin domain-containing protein [Xylophilus sp. GOD-11R]
MPLRILYATVSGNARLVAEAVALDADGLWTAPIDVQDMHDATSAVFEPGGTTLLLCIASTGSGNVPPDAVALYQDLQDAPRYLGGLRYGLVSLGDSSYGSTFGGGAAQFDAALQDLGAERIGEPLQIDAMEHDEPEAVALAWFRDWSESAPAV